MRSIIPAPLFTVVAQPNEFTKETRASASAAISGERGQLQIEFFTRFLTRVSEIRPTWTSSRRGRAQNWLPMSARLQEASFVIAFTGKEMKSELSLVSSDVDLNSQRFSYLQEHADEIEKSFGGQLIWHFPEGNKHCSVRVSAPGDFMNQNSWDQAVDWFIDTQTRLRSALEVHLQALKRTT